MKQSGNVLFLILIAVALFAALSYAVSQSSRTNSGTISEKEKALISQIRGYPVGIKTAISRLTSINGVTDSQLDFITPVGFGALTSAQKKQNVFHPEGGGAIYAGIKDKTFNDPLFLVNGRYYYTISGKNQVRGVGSDNPDISSNDFVAFLPVTQDLCGKINKILGFPSGTILSATHQGNMDYDTYPYAYNSSYVMSFPPFNPVFEACLNVGDTVGGPEKYFYYQVVWAR